MPTAFDPKHFFDLAEQLALNSPDEKSLRTAVGRAYYSMFLLAREKLKVPGKTKTIHLDTQVALKRRNRGAGDMLTKLHRLRKVADYELIPADAAYRDWTKNWQVASTLVRHILPSLY